VFSDLIPRFPPFVETFVRNNKMREVAIQFKGYERELHGDTGIYMLPSAFIDRLNDLLDFISMRITQADGGSACHSAMVNLTK